ncbi:MAG: hypothetical protein LUH47_07910 [Clostridiales bacterium]|nr:hypothetical protein [Clostridiales bacterium]
MDKSTYTFRHVAFEISQNKDITLFNKVNEYNFSYEELENKNIDKDLLDKG